MNRYFKNYMYIVLGSILYIIGLNFFLVPSKIFTTGILGFSQEISYILTDTFSLAPLLYFLINIPILFLGWFKVGRKFTMRTAVVVLITTLLQNIVPNDTQYIEDTLLAVLTGSIIMGLGLGFILRYGASTGGTDIVAVFFSLVKGKGFGVVNIALNSFVIVLAIFVTKDLTTAVYMVISLYSSGLVIDKIHNSHQRLTLIIVTTKPIEMRDVIFEELQRGCTILDSLGGRSFSKNSTIMVTISKEELYLALKILKEADETSFINVLPVESVVGYFQNNFRKNL